MDGTAYASLATMKITGGGGDGSLFVSMMNSWTGCEVYEDA